MKIGIVGHERAKFTELGKQRAIDAIRTLLPAHDSIVVSGGCHLGGVDIWAEEVAKEKQLAMIIHKPKKRSWNGGYKARNMKIAKDSDAVYVIVVDKYPETYKGMHFPSCYHCGTIDHIKSGGCWTGKQAAKLGKPAIWIVIKND